MCTTRAFRCIHLPCPRMYTCTYDVLCMPMRMYINNFLLLSVLQYMIFDGESVRSQNSNSGVLYGVFSWPFSGPSPRLNEGDWNKWNLVTWQARI